MKIKRYFKDLWVIPFNIELKLEAENIGGIARLIKWKALVEILKEQEVNNVFEDDLKWISTQQIYNDLEYEIDKYKFKKQKLNKDRDK